MMRPWWDIMVRRQKESCWGKLFIGLNERRHRTLRPHVCQSTKLVHKKKFGLYKPLPVPSSSFESVLVDFMTCFPKWEGTNAILVVVDMFSKLTKFALTQTNAIMVGTTKLFFNIWVWHNGMMEVIISDWDVKFTSKFWTLLMKKMGTELKFSTIFHS